MKIKWFDCISSIKEKKTEEEQLKVEAESSNGEMVLRTEDLVKKYRQRTVVNHVS